MTALCYCPYNLDTHNSHFNMTMKLLHLFEKDSGRKHAVVLPPIDMCVVMATDHMLYAAVFTLGVFSYSHQIYVIIRCRVAFYGFARPHICIKIKFPINGLNEILKSNYLFLYDRDIFMFYLCTLYVLSKCIMIIILYIKNAIHQIYTSLHILIFC